jgi:transposase
MVHYVGIDLHKRLLVACIVDESGQVVRRKEMEPVTRVTLEHFCETYLTKDDQIAIEATTHVWAVVRIIERYVGRVVVSNPLATKAIATAKVKTDKVDAEVLAQLLRLDYLPSVWQPDAALSRLRELTARRGRLLSQRTALINRIRTTLAMRLLDCPHEILSPAGQDWLAKIELDEDGRFLIDSDLRMMAAVQAEMAALDQRSARHVCADQRVKLLLTLPGVGLQVAQCLVAAIGDIERFSEADKLASYLGLVPSTRQSANRCYHGPITKAGRVQARWMLVQAAHSAARDSGPLGHFFNKLRRRKAYNAAIVGLARKLAVLAWHLLTSGQPYRYAKPAGVNEKLSALRVAGSGIRKRGGVAKGVDPRTMRRADEQRQRCQGLDHVLQNGGLPITDSLKPGEQKFLENIGLSDYPSTLQKPVMRGRKSTQPKPQTAERQTELPTG